MTKQNAQDLFDKMDGEGKAYFFIHWASEDTLKDMFHCPPGLISAAKAYAEAEQKLDVELDKIKTKFKIDY